MHDLTGQCALVVGGSGGIGAATARRLAAAGARVFVSYNRGEARARDLLVSLPGAGHEALPLVIEDNASIVRARTWLTERTERLDILVNSAGFSQVIPHADLEALDDALFDAIMVANVRGPFAVVRALRPLLEASGRAVVVNVSSISGFTGSGSNLAYCASKGALDTLTLSLARALAPTIRVMAVSPGAVATDFLAGRDRTALEAIAAKTPLQTIVDPDDVAEAVLACVWLRSSTGGRIIVDGGRHLV